MLDKLADLHPFPPRAPPFPPTVMDDGPASGPDLISSHPGPRQPQLPDPPSSSAPPKRRWSPCTWRYAIEEVQPELGSKPRNTHILSASSASSERPRPSEPPTKWASAERAGDVLHGGYGQISAGHTSGKDSWEKAGARKKHGLQEADLVEDRMGRVKKKENQESTVEDSSSKRRKREMTPSELYFCEECAQKYSNGGGSSPTAGRGTTHL